MVRPTSSSARVVTFRAEDAARVKTAPKAALSGPSAPTYTAGGMRLGGDMDINPVSPAATPGRVGGVPAATPAGRLRVHTPDEVTISAKARAADAPATDLRSRRLADIKAAIDAGTYETEAKLSAAVDRMLQETA